MKKVQALRKLALMLEPNGTVKVVSSTKLYVGGFGFIGLAVYVPVTQHREGGTNPLLTVHTSAIDPFGKFGSKGKYALPYIGEYEIDGARYMLFERPMPKAFLEKEVELKLIVNYCEVDEENNIVARLTSDAITLKVEAGGIADGESEVVEAKDVDDLKASINGVIATIAQLDNDVDNLLQQPDCTDADNVASEENPLKVEISETGKLKFSNIKGKKGDAATIKVGDVTTLSPNQNATVSNGGTVNDAVLNFGIPQGVKGDKGDAATITVGEVESISYDKSATVANSGSVNDAVLDFKLPQGKPAEITIGKTTTLSPESSAHVDNVGTKNAPILDFAIPQGKAAEVSVGVTRTLPPESVARVENVGTKNAPILDFYIPKGDGFRISKTYASIEAMNAEFESDGVPLYGFVIIETGNVNDEDNARLYYKGEERYEYLTDLSGAQGFKGDTGATPSLTASVSLAEEDSRVPSAEVQVKKSGEQSPEAPLLDLTLKNIVPKINVETKAGTNDVEGSLSIDSTIERVDDTNDYNLTFTFNNIVGGLTKQALGLDNVDNTADVDKPVSIATQEKLNEVKADATNALTAASTAMQEKLDEVKADVANAQTMANNALPKSGGVMTGSLSVDTINGATKGNAILRQDPDSGRVVIGSTQRPLKLIGNGERPKYSNAGSGDLADTGEEVALLSDLSDLPLRLVEIDAMDLDGNTWYPITFQLRYEGRSHIRVYKSLGQEEGIIRVEWSTHGNKSIAYNAEWITYASGWGANPIDRMVLAYDWLWCENPFGELGQMGEGSVEYIYVRGGAKYYCYVSGNVIDAVLRTEKYTNHNQTISPVTTCNANYEKGMSSVDNLRTGTLTANTLKAENINNAWGRPILKTYQLTSDGDCLYVGSGAQTVITAGESVIPLKTVANGTEEQLYLESNYDVYVYSNTQNGIDNAKVWTFGADGKTTTPGGVLVNGGNMTVSSGMPVIDGETVEGVGLAKNGIALRQQPGKSFDAAWLRATGETESETVFEIATGDDTNEPIVARQYNTSGGVAHEMSLLDVNGDTVAARNFITTNGQIIENGARVYSPNNKPSISDITGGTMNGSLNVTGTLSEKGNRVYSKANPPYNNVLTYTSGTACRTALANGSVGAGMRIDYNYTHFLIGTGEVGGIASYQEINESGSGFVTEVTSSSITYMNYSGTRKTISVPNKSGSGLLNKDTYFSGSLNFYY